MLVPVKDGHKEKLEEAWDRRQGCQLQGGSRRPQELGFTAANSQAQPFFLQGRPQSNQGAPHTFAVWPTLRRAC